MTTDLLRNDLAQIATDITIDQERYLTNEGSFSHPQKRMDGDLDKIQKHGKCLTFS